MFKTFPRTGRAGDHKPFLSDIPLKPSSITADLSVIDTVHDRYVHSRRVNVLRQHLANLLPQNARVLDVGCGDGLLSRLIMETRPDLQIEGIDVLVREDTHISVQPFDGTSIPYAEEAYDVVMFVDVLHHTLDPTTLLREAVRVARQSIVLKDHNLKGIFAGPTLRFMDYVGNAHHGVVLPYNYWPESKWKSAFEQLGLKIDVWKADLHLYPAPADWLFGRSLHFVARLATTK